MRAAGIRTRIAIFGLDNFSRKNRSQLLGLNRRGYIFDVFTNDVFGDSANNLPAGNTVHVLADGFHARMRQILAYLSHRASELHHVEVYPGGRFAAVYAALARTRGIPVLVVERGDVLYESRYHPLTRLSMRACYRLANRVWYREHYQELRLRELGARDLFFLSNAVEVRGNLEVRSRPVDFAWVNRLVVERRADWMVDVLAEPEFESASAVILGLLSGKQTDAGIRQQQEYVQARRPPNLQLCPFADPDQLYRESRFFVLPATIVFGNNSLLEAMANGVVPLISDVEGARLIVEDGRSGIIFAHNKEGLRNAMRRALAMSSSEFEQMSRTAAEAVAARHSLGRWCELLAEEYGRLAARS